MKPKQLVEYVLMIALVALVAIQLYDRFAPPSVPGPDVGDVLEIAGVEGPTTVAMFTTTCPWCAKSWPRWVEMGDRVSMVSLSPEGETRAYLAEKQIEVEVSFSRVATPVPVEFDIDENGVIQAKRLGYLGE